MQPDGRGGTERRLTLTATKQRRQASMSLSAHTSLLPFDTETDPGSVGPRWTKWVQRFGNYTTAMNITGDGRLKALLLHLAGERVHDIYDTLAAADDNYEATKTKLSGYFSPKKNIQYQVYIFRKSTQEPGENLDSYHTRLRMLAKTCEFADVDAEIKTQIIQSCTSSRLRRKALREPELTLALLLDHGRTLELSEMQASGIERGAAASVNALEQKRYQKSSRWPDKRSTSNTQCRNCGGKYPHDGECPAKNKECGACGKLNHFARQCRSTPKDKDTK